jgi:soluble lytic murein transglycosylase-like protein
MDNRVSSNSTAKKLGLWISGAALVFSVCISIHPADSNPPQPISDIHQMSMPGISENLPVPPVITAEMTSLNELNWENSERWPRPTPALPKKHRDIRITQKKKAPVRGKQAEHLYRSIILRVSRLHEVDPAMVNAIIMAESSFNPNAISKRGAVGLMQLMPDTAKALGVKDAFDPEHNINGGVLYFKRLLNEFQGNVKLALAAYNAGSRKVKEYQGVPPFKTTQLYIKKVFEYYQHYKNLSANQDDRA